MLKEVLKYVDFDGNEREEEFRFHLTKAELAEMNFSAKGGLEKMITRIINERDTTELIKIFKELLLRSYGKVSDDGRRFIKSPELRTEFEQTQAYSDLYMRFLEDPDQLVKFVEGIVPPDIAEEYRKNVSEGKITPVATTPNTQA